MFAKILILVTILAISANAMNLDMFGDAFEDGFEDGSFMKGFNAEMKKFNEHMELVKDEMAKGLAKIEHDSEVLANRIEEIQAMNATNLTKKISVNGSDDSVSVYNFGGCYCVDLECECCGLVDQLSEEPECIKMSYSTAEKKVPILHKNEKLENLSVFDIKDICADKFCLHFYNIIQKMTSLKGCVDLKVVDTDVQVRLGCFRMDNGNQMFSRNLMSVRNGNETTFYNQMNQWVDTDKMEGLDMGTFINFNKSGRFNNLIMNVNFDQE